MAMSVLATRVDPHRDSWNTKAVAFNGLVAGTGCCLAISSARRDLAAASLRSTSILVSSQWRDFACKSRNMGTVKTDWWARWFDNVDCGFLGESFALNSSYG